MGTMFCGSSGQQAAAEFEGFKFGTLLRINHTIESSLLSRQLLRQVMNHFGTISYIDLHEPIPKWATIRFRTVQLMRDFIAKAGEIEADKIAADDLTPFINQKIPANEALKSTLVRLSQNKIGEEMV